MAELCSGSSWILNISWTNRRLQTEVAFKSFGSDTVWHQDPNRKKNEWQVAILATAWDTSLAGHANCSDSPGTLDWYHAQVLSPLRKVRNSNPLIIGFACAVFGSFSWRRRWRQVCLVVFIRSLILSILTILFRVFRVRSKCRNLFACSVACPQWR